jgi:hypothetical protein
MDSTGLGIMLAGAAKVIEATTGLVKELRRPKPDRPPEAPEA